MASPRSRRPGARRSRVSPVDRLQARLDDLAGGKNCVATAVPLLGGGMFIKCPRPCPRCDALLKLIDDAAPERERLRREYEAAQPKRAPKPIVAGDDDNDFPRR